MLLNKGSEKLGYRVWAVLPFKSLVVLGRDIGSRDISLNLPERSVMIADHNQNGV